MSIVSAIFAYTAAYQTCYQRYRTVSQTTGCCPVSHLIRERRLRFFGHVARADFQQNHHRVIEAWLRLPSHWRRPCGRPCFTWLRGSTLMCSQLTLGSTQPEEKPVTVHSGDASSTRQHSNKGHATEEREQQRLPVFFNPKIASSFWGSGPHLTVSALKSAFLLVQLFLKGSPVWPTHKHTQTMLRAKSVATSRIYGMHAMPPHNNHHYYQNLRSRFGIERYAYTESHIGQIPCVCMCVCMYVCMYVIKLLPNHWTDLHKNYTSK